jgi:hypothetical protein
MDSKENDAFTAHLMAAASIVKRDIYTPKTFIGMVNTLGGFETVKRILSSGRLSEGFEKIERAKRVDLTCEAIAVESPWRRFFDDDLLALAERRLRQVGYPFIRYEGPNDASDRGKLETLTSTRETTPTGSSPSHPSAPTIRPAMGINAFFAEVLEAPVANARWSWGAADSLTRRVYLRVWHDEVHPGAPPTVQVLAEQGRIIPGRQERIAHLDLIRAGYSAYGVMCIKGGPEADHIATFDDQSVYRLGSFSERAGSSHMVIEGALPVKDLPQPTTREADLVSDVAALEDEELPPTTRKALIDARLGQGRYRRQLMHRWNGACAVTGSRLAAILRASHCKPWRRSSPQERLDSANGLLLSANLDALFDSGLISFDEFGHMLIAAAVSADERVVLGLPAPLARTPDATLRRYLADHRAHAFQDRAPPHA